MLERHDLPPIMAEVDVLSYTIDKKDIISDSTKKGESASPFFAITLSSLFPFISIKFMKQFH